MKFILSLSILSASMPLAFSMPSPEGSLYLKSTIVTEQEKEEKREIKADQLPEEARADIRDNYHNGDIIQAYETRINGKKSGYLVEVKKGPKTWFITYDKDGNPENKVNPIK